MLSQNTVDFLLDVTISCLLSLSKQSHIQENNRSPLMPQSKSGSGTRGFLVRL
jgi:hypothetical protein